MVPNMDLNNYLIPQSKNVDPVEYLNRLAREIHANLKLQSDMLSTTGKPNFYLKNIAKIRNTDFEDFKSTADKIAKQIMDLKFMRFDSILLEPNKNYKCNATDTKIGGRFYQDNSSELSDTLLPLIQINFSQMPKIKDLPSNGIFQIFFNNEIDDFSMKYYAKVKASSSASNHKEEFIPKSEDVYHFYINGYPANGIGLVPKIVNETNLQSKLDSFTYKHNYRYGTIEFLISEYINYELNERSGIGTKLLGMDRPCQTGPESYRNNTRLLIQLDSNKDLNIWDAGNIRVYIKENDLKNKKLNNTIIASDGH